MKIIEYQPTGDFIIGAGELRELAARMRKHPWRRQSMRFYDEVSLHLPTASLRVFAEGLDDGEAVCLRISASTARILSAACRQIRDPLGATVDHPSETLVALRRRLNAFAKSMDECRVADEGREEGSATSDLLDA